MKGKSLGQDSTIYPKKKVIMIVIEIEKKVKNY